MSTMLGKQYLNKPTVYVDGLQHPLHPFIVNYWDHRKVGDLSNKNAGKMRNTFGGSYTW